MHDTVRLRPEAELTLAQRAQTYGVPMRAGPDHAVRPGLDRGTVRPRLGGDPTIRAIRPDLAIRFTGDVA